MIVAAMGDRKGIFWCRYSIPAVEGATGADRVGAQDKETESESVGRVPQKTACRVLSLRYCRRDG
jgi:hypothetical protein